MTQSSGTQSTGRTLSIVGIVLGVLAIVILPIILGPIGAILGFLGYRKGDRLGLWAIGVGIAGTVLGMILGAALLASFQSG